VPGVTDALRREAQMEEAIPGKKPAAEERRY
jgi:hypothetical protein